MDGLMRHRQRGLGGFGRVARRCTALLVLFMMSFPWSGAAPAEETLDAGPLIARFLGRLHQAAGYQAQFVQTNRWAVFDEADYAYGTLSIAPPQRFRFDYEDPPGHLVGCDGDFVWTFIPEEMQVLRAGVHHTTGLGELFWAGLGQRADSLATVEADSSGRRLARLKLQPRPEWGVNDLAVFIDLESEEPAAYVYVDEEGNEVRFEFLSWTLLSSVPDSLFRFRPPENYELLDVD